MSYGSPNTWSRLFHSKSSNHSRSSSHLKAPKPKSIPENPFHRPPSSAGSYASNASEATFRTGNTGNTSSSAHQSGSSSSGLSGYQKTTNTAHSVPRSSPLMSSHDIEDEGECPVCLEPLSFSFRLPGEKPHVVPECGHALHEACFSAVYGPLPARNPAGGIIPRKSSLGVCGVCRRPMKVSDGDTGKSNKLAALTGMGERAAPSPYVANQQGPSGGPSAQRGRDTPSTVYDPTEDDPVEKDRHHNGHSSANSVPVVAPSITVRSEFATINRSQQPVQPLTCIVVVELPSRRNPSGQIEQQETFRSIIPASAGLAQDEGVYSGMNTYQSQQPTHISRKPSLESGTYSNYNDQTLRRDVGKDTSGQDGAYGLPQSHGSYGTTYHPPQTSNTNTNSYSTAAPSYNSGSSSSGPDSPFHSITEDLKQRVADWKGHPMSGLGPLQMFDILSVRRDVLVREFYVYLFKEAIICVLEEKKKSLGRLLSPVGDNSSTNGSTFSNSNKGILRLKGRIYIRHIKQVHDTSSAGELSLTIDMEDERLESFILIFKDRATLESWRTNISNLVIAFQQGTGSAQASTASSGRGTGETINTNSVGLGGGSRSGHGELDDFGTAPLHLSGGSAQTIGPNASLPKGISAKAARMLSGSSDGGSSSSMSHIDSLLNGGRSAASSTTSALGGYQSAGGNTTYGSKLSKVPSEEQLQYTASSMGLESRTITPHVAAAASNSLQPLPHPSLDLILVISVPPASSSSPAYTTHLSPATAQLKVRVIKNTLDFVLAQLGPRDRLSLVTFEVGAGGAVRKTPFLCPGKPRSKKRLEKFVNGIYGPEDPHTDLEDEFLVRNVNEEKTDVVTAVNHGLDVVLQRKGKNNVSGMVLVSDAADSTRRAQMDLVLARAEAANVPIHSFGYGRSHDPASLWLISNHTSGTYTFVKDWYDLRDCLAGCLGGMMSIALLNMKLHMKIVDANRFRIRKVSGGPTAIVAQDGKDVHVEVGELRYGERKEMLIELELDNNLDIMRMNAMMGSTAGVAMPANHAEPLPGRNGGMMNATDAFVARMGLDISGESPNLFDGMMDRMLDEVPVFEVDGSFYDPAASRQANRLAHPVLLTVTLLPIARQPQTPNQAPVSDAVIVRRRMELLASDMVTRALVLVSRKNYPQAQRILAETRRILHTVLQSISQSLPPPSARGTGGPGNTTPSSSGTISGMGMARNRKEVLIFSAVRTLQAMLQDLQLLMDALEENVDMFAHDQRNFGAQQAMILRDQKSWSKRSAVERLFWTVDNCIELVARSADWVGRD